VVDGQRLSGVDDAVQVRLHQVLHDVHVVELFSVRRGRDDIDDADDLQFKAQLRRVQTNKTNHTIR
jgi:hypothetical protein